MVFLLTQSCHPAWACLNLDFAEELITFENLNNSHSVNPGDVFFEHVPSFYEERAAHWQAEWKAHGRWQDRSRYAVCLAFLEDYDLSLEHFLDIDAAHPNQSRIAVHIATIYELKRDYKKALKWMEKAIALGLGSSEGVERIHLNVLRLEAEGRQHQCTSIDLIGHDFGTGSAPETTLSQAELEELQTDIFTFLDQRLYFNGEPEPCAARLLFELGNLNYLAEFPTASLMNYGLAADWGFESEVMQARRSSVSGANYSQPPPTDADSFYRANGIDPAEAAQQKWTAEQRLQTVFAVAAFIIPQLVLLFFALRLRRKRGAMVQAAKRKKLSEFEQIFIRKD